MSDTRIDQILLEQARRSLRVTRQQMDSLRLLAYLSKTLRLIKTGESKTEYAVWLRVRVDGDREVDIDWDGALELLPSGEREHDRRTDG